MAEAILKYQYKTGIWYQVTDMGDREGNYLEASGMAMFACSFVKGANMGHLPQLYKADANTAFDGFVRDLIKNVEDGEPLSTQVCALAGLGG